MISEHLPTAIDRPQKAVFIGIFIDEFPDAEAKQRSGEKKREGGVERKRVGKV